jgi:hypothetical protein
MLSFKYSEGKYVRTEEEITCKLPHWHYIHTVRGTMKWLTVKKRLLQKLTREVKLVYEENLIHKLHISVWTKSEIEETWK